MANGNFVVQNGLQIGPLTIDAATGSITTTGNISSTSGITVVTQELVLGTEVVAGNLVANSGASSTSTTTGALVVAGGAGISGNVYVGNLITSGPNGNISGVNTIFTTGLQLSGNANIGSGSSLHTITGNISMTGSIIPSANVTYDLGSRTNQWHSIYVGPGTLYVNGKAVIQDNSGTITLSTTSGQNLQMATSGGGTIQLTTNAGSGGVIAVQGPLQVAAGNNITSSDGNPIQIANAIGVDTISTHTNNTNLSLSAQGTGKIAVNNSITGGGTVTIADTTASVSSSTGALVVSGGVGVNGDLRISGNVYSNGILAVQTQQLNVNAPMVYLSASPAYPYSYDIGMYSHFIGGAANAYSHTGVVRDHSDNTWKFFANCTSEPTTTVNFSDTNLYWDKVKTGDHIIANTTASSSTTTGALQVAGGAGIAGAVYAGSLNTGSGTIQTTGTVQGGTLTGTLSTAAQTNITSVGTLTGLTVSGALNANGQLNTAASIIPTNNNTQNIGSSSYTYATVYATTFSGVSTTAKYADLAENYQADKQYNPGTVLMFGGDQEVTVADAETTAVAGVVSTNPAHLMNGALSGPNVVAVAFTGRVPCNVIGPVKKGDLMVSAGFGFAKTNNTPQVGTIIGKALQDFPVNAKGVIEVVVGRF